MYVYRCIRIDTYIYIRRDTRVYGGGEVLGRTVGCFRFELFRFIAEEFVRFRVFLKFIGFEIISFRRYFF